MQAEAEIKLLKKENTALLSRLEADDVELQMLRAAIAYFKNDENIDKDNAAKLDLEFFQHKKECETQQKD